MLNIRVLGELFVELDGTHLELPARAQELLAWFAVHPGLHDRGRVAAVFWPDVTDDAARNNLRQTLWTLRRSLGHAGHLLVTTRQRVGLDDEAGGELDVDLWRQRAALEADDIDLALHRTEALLPDLYSEWAEDARADHRKVLTQALDRAAWRAEEASDHHRAVALTERLVELDEYSEHAHREFIRRLATAGDRTKALAVYERLVVRLRDDLGVEPSPETARLAARLRTIADLGDAGVTRLTKAEHRFVGRHDELRALRSTWAQARTGPARSVVVTGDGGVGKTRLVYEFTQLAVGEGALVLSGRATEEALVPYQPWVEALRRCILTVPDEVIAEIEAANLDELTVLVPELTSRGGPSGTPPAPSSADRYRMFEAVAGLLALLALRLPVVVVLDDMHWADQSTLLLLRHVIEATAEHPILIVITYRDSEPRAGQLRAALAELRTQRVSRHVLRGLGGDEIADLVTEFMGASPPGKLVEILEHRTDGNPYFILEVVRDLSESGALVVRDGNWIWSLADARVVIPETITQTIERRLGSLDPAARSVLEVAAVVGFQFTVEIVDAVADIGADALLDALDASVGSGVLDEIVGELGRYRFAHPLAWEVVYHGLSANRRGQLHGRVAAAIEAGRDVEQPDVAVELARHLLRSPGDLERTLRFTTVAAERLIAARAFDEAVELCEAALGLVPESDIELRRVLLTKRGIAIGTLTADWLHPDRVPTLKFGGEPPAQKQ